MTKWFIDQAGKIRSTDNTPHRLDNSNSFESVQILENFNGETEIREEYVSYNSYEECYTAAHALD